MDRDNRHAGDPIMNRNSSQRWSEMDLWDLRNSLSHGRSTNEVADFLCRDTDEIRPKMAQLGIEERPETLRNIGCA